MGGNTGNFGEAWTLFLIELCTVVSSLNCFVMFVIAGGVALGSPFNALPIITLIIGVIGIVSLLIMIYYHVWLFCHDSHHTFNRFHSVVFFISRSIYFVMNIISFPVGIILAVGFFSLISSLDIFLFTRAYEEVAFIIDDKTHIQKEMISAGVLLILGSVFVIIPIIYSLVPSCHRFYGDRTKSLDELVHPLAVAVVQLLWGLVLFLPLQLLGRAGLAPFGWAGLRDSTYRGLCVLGIVAVVLGAVNIVLYAGSFVRNWTQRIVTASRALGVFGCVVSIAILVYASVVLVERTKADSNLQAFCTADGGLSPHCSRLLTRFKANMCAGKEVEGEEGGKARCEDRYAIDDLQGKMLLSTRGWMGFTGFACIFLALVHIGISLLVSLCYKSKEARFCLCQETSEDIESFDR